MTSFLYIVHKICSGISANAYEEKFNTVMMESVKRNKQQQVHSFRQIFTS